MGNECLQQMVAERDEHLGKLTQGPSATAPEIPAAGTAHAEVVVLREQLKEKDVLIAELRSTIPDASPVSPLEDDDRDYEAELTDFRRQLEAGALVRGDRLHSCDGEQPRIQSDTDEDAGWNSPSLPWEAACTGTSCWVLARCRPTTCVCPPLQCSPH